MKVMDAFAITGRGGVVTGRVSSGSVSAGDTVCMVSEANGSREYVVGAVAKSGQEVEFANTGDIVSVELGDYQASDLDREGRAVLRGSCRA